MLNWICFCVSRFVRTYLYPGYVSIADCAYGIALGVKPCPSDDRPDGMHENRKPACLCCIVGREWENLAHRLIGLRWGRGREGQKERKYNREAVFH